MALQAEMDAADTVSRTLATGLVLWQDSWLHLSRFPRKVQITIQDLPFNESNLFFNGNTDESLQLLKDLIYFAVPGDFPSFPQEENTRDSLLDKDHPLYTLPIASIHMSLCTNASRLIGAVSRLRLLPQLPLTPNCRSRAIFG